MKKKFICALASACLFLGATSCNKDYLNTFPSSTFDEEQLTNVNTKNGTEGILQGIHGMLYQYSFGQWFGNGLHSLNTRIDWISDLYVNTRPAYYMGIYRWDDHVDPYGGMNYSAWDSWYTVIQHCNKVIAKSNPEQYETEGHFKEVLAEAYLLRAHAMSNLVQYFAPRYNPGGDNSELGIIIRTEPTLDPQARGTVEETYAQITQDLKTGLDLMGEAAEKKSLIWEKNRINLPVAYGIAARALLGKRDYAGAEKYALLSIQTAEKVGFARLQTGDELLNGFNSVSSAEWIWGYKYTLDQNPMFAAWGAHYSYNFGSLKAPTYAINRSYFDKMGMKDVRRRWFIARDYLRDAAGNPILDAKGRPQLPPIMDIWNDVPENGSGTLFKKLRNGKPDWEYTGQQIKFATLEGAGNAVMDAVFMRLGEMYYIAAEAQARQGKLAEASKTLTKVMSSRDPQYVVPSGLSADDLAFEVLRNKWIDLYYEGGVFFDQKRIGHVCARLQSGNDKYLDPADLTNFKVRNSGTNAMNIAKDANSKKWVFAIPYDELKGNKLCEQNPL